MKFSELDKKLRVYETAYDFCVPPNIYIWSQELMEEHLKSATTVEIKAKQEDKTINLKVKEDKNTLKFRIKVKNGQAVSEPFYLNPNWYNEEIEKYNYFNHQTKINLEKALTFVFEAKFTDGNRVYKLPREDNDKLRPVTYRRNYEEPIGLFKTDTKSKEKNYENRFINSNSEIKTIVDEFIEKVIEKDITISEIKTLVEEKAKALWDTAVKQVQGYTKTIKKEIIYSEKVRAEMGLKNDENTYEDIDTKVKADLDDRPLYWARNKMQTWLKRNPLFKDEIDFEKSLVKKGTELDNIIILFEEKSRNYKGIDFSKAGNKKKVLITGFDPFLLNSIKKPKRYNILQSNPSGVVALALNNDDTLGAFIQTMMFPVRYLDFDGNTEPTEEMGIGVVEDYIEPFISKVDAIITISQAGPNDYNIDVFGTLTRGGYDENLNYTREPLSKAISTDLEWIKTTLNSGFTDVKEVKYEWHYTDENGITKNGEINPPKEGIKIEKGSGSNYLSNEIFYRVGKMRPKLKPNLETGHFHIAKIQDEEVSEDLNPTEIAEVLAIVKKSLNQGIKKLK